MIRAIDTDEVLTELQALAEDSTGAVTVAILACMDVVDRHARVVDEAEIAEHIGEQPVEPEQPPLQVQRYPGFKPGGVL